MIEERALRALHSRSAGSAEDVDKAQADREKFDAQVEADRANLEQARADYEVGILAARSTGRGGQGRRARRRDQPRLLPDVRHHRRPDRRGESQGRQPRRSRRDGGSFSDLATIHQLDPMGIEIRTSSRYLKRATQLIQEGLAVRLFHAGFEGMTNTLTKESASSSTTPSMRPRRRSWSRPGSPTPSIRLLPGEYAKLQMVVDRIKDAVVVPESAVMETESGPVVYVVDGEGKVAIQRVKAAQSYEGMRILTEGLAANVPVILQGLQLVRPRIPVKTEPAVIPRPVKSGSATAENQELPRE